MNRWTPSMGEIFQGDKPELFGPKVDLDKVLDILLGQLDVLRVMTCPPIYIPTEDSSKAGKV